MQLKADIISIAAYITGVPRRTYSVRGREPVLYPLVKAVNGTRDSSCGQRKSPTSLGRRDFLRMSAIGAVAAGVSIRDWGGPASTGACYADPPAPVPPFTIYGLASSASPDDIIAVLNEVFRPALRSYINHVFKPYVRDRDLPAVESFLDTLDDQEKFTALVHSLAQRPLKDEEKNRYDNARFDRFLIPESAAKIPMMKIRGIDFEVGFIGDIRPRALNIVELEGMRAENVFGVPAGRRVDFTKNYEDYKKDFDLLNELHHGSKEKKFTPNEVDYVLPLVHSGDGKRYTGFAIKRSPRSTTKLNRAFLMTWERGLDGDDGKEESSSADKSSVPGSRQQGQSQR